LFRLFGYPLAPLILAVVLGPIVEESLHQSLLITGGDVVAMVTRPIPLAIYGAVGAISGLAIVLRIRRQGRGEALPAGDEDF
jgi:putative tricarboxylic transport membrane protein